MSYTQTVIVGVGVSPTCDDSSMQHMYIDIVMIAKAQGVHPVLYDLNQVSTLSNHHEKILLPRGGMLMMGQVANHDKEKKIIQLLDPNAPSKKISVSYKHLIIASQLKGAFDDEFSAGLQALADALKIQKKLPETFSAPHTENDKRLLKDLAEKSKLLNQNDLKALAIDSIIKTESEGNPFLLSSGKKLFEVQL